ncbi:hypothetical protein ACRALDRAFT_1046169 [Sodiomyces alcalophilus JCM 7366]|uniref:uncharacterized protein n=1 Tax=Sodiomyces alcalophilus JCM 7366 TaxID=591952 RepID=UPI0039B3FE80
MPSHLSPESVSDPGPEADEAGQLRSLNRSPHPYHHLNRDLAHAAHRLSLYRSASTPSAASTSPTATFDSTETDTATTAPKSDGSGEIRSSFPSFAKESTPPSDSGTEADDEHFLKGLPAPKARLHKGLRGRNEVLSGTSSPTHPPSPLEPGSSLREDGRWEFRDSFWEKHNYRRFKELMRRILEFAIVATLFVILQSNHTVKTIVRAWTTELRLVAALIASLMLLYPLRLVSWTYRHRKPSKKIPITIPTVFDPAPVLYPPAVTMLVSLLLSADNSAVILPNLVLSISSIPRLLIPTARSSELINTVHWAISCLPLYWASSQPKMFAAMAQAQTQYTPTPSTGRPALNSEMAVLLYPLHQTLLAVLHYLTTTSLLPAELQLLSIGLINLLLLTYSPQAVVLRVLLWVGGVSVLVLCGPVIRWGIALARVPRLRFQQAMPVPRKSWFTLVSEALLLRRRSRSGSLRSFADDSASELLDSEDEMDTRGAFSRPSRVHTFGPDRIRSPEHDALGRPSTAKADWAPSPNGSPFTRTSTFPRAAVNRPRRSATHTFSGRRKREPSITVRSFFKFTETEAKVRKWLYSTYVHLAIVFIILKLVRGSIGRYALHDYEAVGWALGYMFGNIPWFRFRVVWADLERWICLPSNHGDLRETCHLGWVQHIRHADFGEANTRLLISAYWFAVIVFGLVVVVRLDPKYEVDTRRKVFHFMMVAMFLPATYVDPIFAALALSFALAIFLTLDLLRASQLPPLSRPIAFFLTPYVDGRDYKGPVVISHIFLLIGCAIPLWLTLGTLPRTGTGTGAGTRTVPGGERDDPLYGWEVATREVSMVSGVVCVGLGDAAASLIGRRYGHRKWLWGGGKSIEGSAAFAVAVFAGLMAAAAWLRVGGWAVSPDQDVSWPVSARNAGLCAGMASLTETVLTGGNDNVVVPVVLWTCVKSLGV